MGLMGCGGPSSVQSTFEFSGTNLQGVAFKGPFKQGLGGVMAYKFPPDDQPIATGDITDDSGSFSLMIPASFKGPLLLKAFGAFADEATGLEVEVDEEIPMLGITMVSEVKQGIVVTAPVTISPLTHILSNEILSVKDRLPEKDFEQSLLFVQERAKSIARSFGLNKVSILAERPRDITAPTGSVEEYAIQYGSVLAGISKYLLDTNQNYSQYSSNVLTYATNPAHNNFVSFKNSLNRAISDNAVLKHQALEDNPHLITIANFGSHENLHQHFVSFGSTAQQNIATGKTLSVTATVSLSQGAMVRLNWKIEEAESHFGQAHWHDITSTFQDSLPPQNILTSESTHPFAFTTSRIGRYKITAFIDQAGLSTQSAQLVVVVKNKVEEETADADSGKMEMNVTEETTVVQADGHDHTQ